MIRAVFRLNTAVFTGIIYVFSFTSCEILDPKEQIPAYINIDTINLATDYLTQGSTSSKFTDAWVYIDDQPLGTYALPATIPILKEGNHQIKVRGGIKINGISATRAAYSMCTFYTQNIDLQLNNPVTVKPVVNYFPAVVFNWKEDFESIGISLTKSTDSDTSIIPTNDPTKVFEGARSGAVYLDGNKPFFQCETPASTAYYLPLEDVFLELNYKCNNEFTVGVYAYGNGAPFPAIVINPSAEWNKIYINLADAIGISLSNPYQIFISMAKSPDVDFPELYLDNIKLVHQ